MRYLLIILIVALIVCILLFLSRKRQGTYERPLDNELMVVEQLPVGIVKNQAQMVEIKDEHLIAQVNQAIPSLAKASHAVNKVANTNKEVLYRVIIPNGEKLTKSKEIPDAYRAFYRGKKGIKGQANLVQVKQKGEIVANATAAAMDVASMVVGQYYMSQINEELKGISSELSKIEGFQNAEYKGKVFSLMSAVETMLMFQSEVLSNEELRSSEIIKLDRLEENCRELLGQANFVIEELTKKEEIRYEQYVNELEDVQKWYIYQTALLKLLHEIAELKYALHLGKVSKEQCFSSLSIYVEQTAKTQNLLLSWHKRNSKRLGVETEKARRKREGVDGIVHWLPGLLNEELNFRPISSDVVAMIEMQSKEMLPKQNQSDLFLKEVCLISREGKLFYLPFEKENAKEE